MFGQLGCAYGDCYGRTHKRRKKRHQKQRAHRRQTRQQRHHRQQQHHQQQVARLHARIQQLRAEGRDAQDAAAIAQQEQMQYGEAYNQGYASDGYASDGYASDGYDDMAMGSDPETAQSPDTEVNADDETMFTDAEGNPMTPEQARAMMLQAHAATKRAKTGLWALGALGLGALLIYKLK